MQILAVHQGNELYGSDRSFIAALEAIRPIANKLTVHLPASGSISELIKPLADEIIYGNLGVLRRGQVGKLLTTLPKQVLKARMRMQAADLVYINTCVVADYLIASRFVKTKTVCHVREMPPEGRAGVILKKLLRFAKCTNIYNSHATQQSFNMVRCKKEFVVHNGVDIQAVSKFPEPCKPLKILMVGRLNSWKGQDVLVRATSQSKDLNLKVRIVGGVYEGQTHFKTNLEQLIQQYDLQETIELLEFTDNISGHLNWSDIVIVPSKKPEPFGRVAIEAMAAKRAVIASKHGGLVEIVEDNESGLLCKPDDSIALAKAIAFFHHNPEQIMAMAEKGYARYQATFTQIAYQEKIQAIIKQIYA